jgi:GxxExxY protein
MLHSEITDVIIKAYYLVYNELGYGFLEKVYERALLFELRSRGLMCESQIPIKVYYKGFEMGGLLR